MIWWSSCPRATSISVAKVSPAERSDLEPQGSQVMELAAREGTKVKTIGGLLEGLEGHREAGVNTHGGTRRGAGVPARRVVGITQDQGGDGGMNWW